MILLFYNIERVDMKTLVAMFDGGYSKYSPLFSAMKNVLALPKKKALVLARTKPIIFNEFD